MSKDLARIKDKEQALDAENKILRAQIFQNSKKNKTKSVSKASDYHKLPGEFTPDKSKDKAKVTTGYAKLAGDGAISSGIAAYGSFDDEPVKLVARGRARSSSNQ